MVGVCPCARAHTHCRAELAGLGAPPRLASDHAAMADECARTDADIVLAGHSGVPLAQQVKQQWWLNAGVIGMPANDGDPRTWFMVLTPDATGL